MWVGGGWGLVGAAGCRRRDRSSGENEVSLEWGDKGMGGWGQVEGGEGGMTLRGELEWGEEYGGAYCPEEGGGRK